MNSAWATAGPSHEIKIDESHRVLNSPVFGYGRAFYVALIIGLLAVTCGFTWIILKVSALPFGLTLVGASTGNRLSSNLDQSSNATSDRMPEAQKEERLQSHDTIADKVDRDALATLQSMKLSSASGASVGTAPSKHSMGVQRTGLRSGELRSATKLPPVPETSPTTIPGWTLREVTNGTALLEGPNGIWRVMPGQTVPSVGRVDSIVRWGNRFIVATSSGLISTP